MEESQTQYEYNYENEFTEKIKQNSFTNEQKYQLTYIKLLLEKRLQLENEYKRKYQEIQLKYEKKFQPNYDMRNKLISGELLPDSSYPFYLQYSITLIKGTPSEIGIPGFWVQCIKNSYEFRPILSNEDIPVLKELNKLECQTEENGDYSLIFTFNKNYYFAHHELKLSFIYDKKRLILQEVKGTDIKWKSDQMNPTIKWKSKMNPTTKANGSAVSFFNIFDSITNEETQNGDGKLGGFQKVEDLGCHVKEDLIPNAIEYYFNLIDNQKKGNCYRGYDDYDDDDDFRDRYDSDDY